MILIDPLPRVEILLRVDENECGNVFDLDGHMLLIGWSVDMGCILHGKKIQITVKLKNVIRNNV